MTLLATINTSGTGNSAIGENAFILTEPVRTTSPTKSQAETNYTTVSPDPTRHCAICEHYVSPGVCELVMPEPELIVPEGVCDLFDAVEAEMPDMQEMTIAREQIETGATGKGYVYIPVRWAWEVERLQSALITLYGWSEDLKWVDSYTLHLTLAYAANITDAQMIEAAKAVVGKPTMRLNVIRMGTFPSENGTKAIYLQIAPDEQLATLQKDLYDVLTAAGVELSPLSAPDAYVPHITLAYVPEATVVPEVARDMHVWAEEVVLGRSNFESIGKLNLTWSRPVDYGDMGDSPTLLAASENWHVKAAPDLEVVDGEWDAKSAIQGVAEAAFFGTPVFQQSMMASAFLLVNMDAPTLPSSYRFPFAEMKDGKLVASKAGLKRALEQIKKSPDSEMLVDANRAMETYRKNGAVSEMDHPQEKIRSYYISEMRGKYPDIPLPDDIDRTALGETAFFVTLPIGQAGAKSRNGRVYSKPAMTQMVEQINAQRPEGMWGHVAANEIATRYDPPAMRWLAAEMDSEGVVWGKGLPLNEETREYYRLAKATNARVGTSLVAWAELDGDEVKALELVTVDLADPARVGIQMTAAKAMISTEMAMTDVYVKASEASPTLPVPRSLVESEQEMANESVAEMTVLTEERNRLQETVVELQGHKEGLTTQITEQTQRAETAEATVATQTATISELLGEYMVAAIDKAQKVATLRPMMMRFLKDGKPQTKAEIDAKVTEMLDWDEFKVAAKSSVQESMGGKIDGVPKNDGEVAEMFPVGSKDGE